MTTVPGSTFSSAVVAQRPGLLAEVLTLRQLSEPSDLGPDEVIVRMTASTVNPSDAVTVSGAYGSRTEFPFVPGFEGVGVITQTGSNVPAGVLGRKVLPIGSAGCWSQRKRVPLSWCIFVPDDLPDEIACFAYINPLTAHLMIQRFWSSRARDVAVTAATSTIAEHLAQLLNQRGVRPIGLIRGTPGRTVARPSLWRAVIDTSDPAWPENLRSECGSNLDLAFDCVGGTQGFQVYRQLAPGGVLVHYGLVSGQPLPSECFDQRNGTRVEMFRLRDTIHAHPRDNLSDLFDPVFAHLRSGRLLTRILHRVPLTSLPGFVRDAPFSSGGKILISCQC